MARPHRRPCRRPSTRSRGVTSSLTQRRSGTGVSLAGTALARELLFASVARDVGWLEHLVPRGPESGIEVDHTFVNGAAKRLPSGICSVLARLGSGP